MAANSNQTYPSNGATATLSLQEYWITFHAKEQGGLTAMQVTGTGSVRCSADNGTGGIFSGPSSSVNLPPHNATFNPPVTLNTLGYIPIDLGKLDCNFTIRTDKGPKQASTDGGTITLSATATDTLNRQASGQLIVKF